MATSIFFPIVFMQYRMKNDWDFCYNIIIVHFKSCCLVANIVYENEKLIILNIYFSFATPSLLMLDR